MSRRNWHCLAWLSAAAILVLGWPARSADRAATRPATRPAATAPAGEVRIDPKARTLTVPAVVAKQGKYEVLKGAIEYVLVSEGGKDYEALFVTRAAAKHIHQGLAKIGLTPGRPAAANAPAKGKLVEILAVYELKGKTRRRAVDEFILRIKTGKPLEPRPWVFTGSAETVDPDTNEKVLQASLTHSIVGLHYTDASPLFQNPRPEARTENIYKANLKELPPAGTAVRIVFRRVMPKLPAGVRRVHAFISGRVQGVGFRAFTQHQGRLLKLSGWVRNLPDGRVEAVIEGPSKDVDKLLAKLKRGPRPARVTTLQAKDEPPEGDLRGFEVRY